MATAPKTLAKQIIRAAWDKKAEDIALLNLKKLSNMADYLVVMSAGSDVQVRAIADHVQEVFKGREVILHTEGYEAGHWILIDCFSVIVHIFRPEVREYYGLESLWGDAPREEFPDGL